MSSCIVLPLNEICNNPIISLKNGEKTTSSTITCALVLLNVVEEICTVISRRKSQHFERLTQIVHLRIREEK